MSKYSRKDKYANIAEHGGEGSELKGRMKTLELDKIKAMFVNNEEVKLRVKSNNKKYPIRIVEGKVIQKNDFLVAIKTNVGIESFNYSDLINLLEKSMK